MRKYASSANKAPDFNYCLSFLKHDEHHQALAWMDKKMPFKNENNHKNNGFLMMRQEKGGEKQHFVNKEKKFISRHVDLF